MDAVKRLYQKGLISEEDASAMSDEAAVDLVFLPGSPQRRFLRRRAGRGVGMDVVRTNVSKLNGYVEIITKKNSGSTMRISLPDPCHHPGNDGAYRRRAICYSQSLVEESIKVKRRYKRRNRAEGIDHTGKVLPCMRCRISLVFVENPLRSKTIVTSL